MVQQIQVKPLSVTTELDRLYKPLFEQCATSEEVARLNQRLRKLCYGLVRNLLGELASRKTSNRRLVLTMEIDDEMVPFLVMCMHSNGGIARYNQEVLDACRAFVMHRMGGSPLRFPEFLGDGVALGIVTMLYEVLPQRLS